MPPGRHFAILTCMDARLDPGQVRPVSPRADAHVHSQWPGARASDDAIRLAGVISYKLLGTRGVVRHPPHRTAAMQTFHERDHDRVAGAEPEDCQRGTATGWHDSGPPAPASVEGAYINFLTISDLARASVEDVKRIRDHPLVPGRHPESTAISTT